jgi:predicted phosphodiesterase
MTPRPMRSDRIAALYDVHGNLPALEAVLEDVAAKGIVRIVFGGDLVLGPMPKESLQLARSVDGASFIRGNCDRLVAAAAAGEPLGRLPAAIATTIEWCARQLDASEIAFLRGLPQALSIAVSGPGPVRFVHATARSDEENFTKRTGDDLVAEMFAGVTEPTVVCGHTHMQFVRTLGSLMVVNAGSVGMPYGLPGAYWCEVGDEVRLQRTPYDLRGAAEKVRATAYPAAEQFAAREILSPMPEETILEALTR